MRKLIVFLGVLALVSCSKDDDCKYNQEELDARYEALMENDNLTAEQRSELAKTYKEQSKEAC